MQKIIYTKNLKFLDKIPEAIGLYTIKDDKNVLYCDYSANIHSSMEYIFRNTLQNKNFAELSEQAKEINWLLKSSLFEALKAQLLFNSKYHPPLNQTVKLWENYVYLMIDYNRPPFIHFKENTIEDGIYLGPFRSRFLISDYLHVLNDFCKTPACDTDIFPCHLYDEQKCDGLCIEKNKEKVFNKLQKYFLLPQTKLIKRLKKEYQNLLDDLEFSKADLLIRKIRVLEKYQDNLNFLKVTKDLEMDIIDEKTEIQIKNGLIDLMIIDKNPEIIHSQIEIELDYRKNEVLAVNKDQYDERRVIYSYLKKKYPKMIKEIIKNKNDDIEKSKWRLNE